MRKTWVKFIFFILLSLSTGFSAHSSSASIREDILNLLPQEITTLSSKQTAAEVKKIFSKKIREQEKDTLYLNYFSKNQDVTIGLKKNHYNYTYLEPPQSLNRENKNLFSDIYSKLTPAQKKKVNSSLQGTSHEKGTLIVVDLPDQGLKLKFNNNEEKLLHSVLIWTVGGERP